jgi:hypothetical protein
VRLVVTAVRGDVLGRRGCVGRTRSPAGNTTSTTPTSVSGVTRIGTNAAVAVAGSTTAGGDALRHQYQNVQVGIQRRRAKPACDSPLRRHCATRRLIRADLCFRHRRSSRMGASTSFTLDSRRSSNAYGATVNEAAELQLAKRSVHRYAGCAERLHQLRLAREALTGRVLSRADGFTEIAEYLLILRTGTCPYVHELLSQVHFDGGQTVSRRSSRGDPEMRIGSSKAVNTD